MFQPKRITLAEGLSRPRMVFYVAILIVAAILVYFLAVRGLRFFKVPSASMEPTLLEGDFLMTVKEPVYQRGDIVVLIDPEDKSGYIVKRVAGVGGDSVRVEFGALWINGAYASEPYLAEPMQYDLLPAVQVPPGQVLVLGDNRNKSEDSSRWTQKTLPLDAIVEKVAARYLPIARAGKVRGYPLTNSEGS